jgi:pimeloyl-ACP methyl ester carboxylesterase
MDEPVPLVLLPGRMSTSVSWSYQLQVFSAQRRVIVPDGHMRLSSMTAMADDIAKRLPDRFDLVAWSMGGYVFFELYRLIASRIRRLVLVSTSARAETEASTAARLEMLALAEREGLQAVQAQGLRKAVLHPGRLEKDFVAALHTSSLALGVETLASQTRAIIGRRDQRAGLGAIACPTLVVVGAHDTITPPECSREIAAGIAGARLVVIEEAGHSAPFEQPDTFNALVGGHLGPPARGGI